METQLKKLSELQPGTIFILEEDGFERILLKIHQPGCFVYAFDMQGYQYKLDVNKEVRVPISGTVFEITQQ